MNASIQQFLFAEANPRSVAILRIWIAAGVAYFFFPGSTPTLSALIRAPWTNQLYQDVFFTPAYWGLALVPLAAFAAGLWSRSTGLLAALLLAPCVPTLHVITSRYLLWFALTALSLLNSDRSWALRDALGRPQTAAVGPIWPIRLIQCQLSVLYLVNAVAKSSISYLSGGALAAMSQQVPNFQLDLTDGVFPLAGVAIPLWMAATASAAVEYSLAIGFWIPSLRWPTAALGVAFHWGLTWIVVIGGLNIVSIGLYIVFLLPLSAGERRWTKRC